MFLLYLINYVAFTILNYFINKVFYEINKDKYFMLIMYLKL